MNQRLLAILVPLILLTMAAFSQIKPRPIIKAVSGPDSITTQSVIWTIDTVLTAGSKSCLHVFQTVPGGEKRKDYGTDSLNTLYNPQGERVVQEICLKCGREIVKSETITTRKAESDYRKIKQLHK